MKKQRLINMEVLRILAMAMVVSLHYLGKGEILPELTSEASFGTTGHLAWILETLSICAVNTYVLISAYFLTETGFRCKRILSLICQVLFYTILTPLVLSALGIIHISDFTTYDFLQNLLPIQMMQYWFVSAYVLLFLFAPILKVAVHAMGRKQHGAVSVIRLIMESLFKTILPVRLELDNLGYDALWFMVVYLIAAYIRLYGIPFLEKKNHAISLYFLGLGILFGFTMLIRQIFLRTGQLTNYMDTIYGYNQLLNIGCAVCLFYCFKNWTYPRGKVASALGKVILTVAPCTFGIYLLHEQNQMRYLWQFWLGAEACTTPLALLGHWCLAILSVMVVGTGIDLVRRALFSLVDSLISRIGVVTIFEKGDAYINGQK